MQAAQIGRNRIDVGDDVVSRKMSAQVATHVFGEIAMPTTDEKRCEESHPAEAVNGDHAVHVLDEGVESFRGRRRHLDRRDVSLHADRLVNTVVTRPGPFGGGLRHDLGDFFESAAVIRHETDSVLAGEFVSAQNTNLFHFRMIEEFSKPRHDQMTRFRRRTTTLPMAAMPITSAVTMARVARLPSIQRDRCSCQPITRPVRSSSYFSRMSLYQYQAR